MANNGSCRYCGGRCYTSLDCSGPMVNARKHGSKSVGTKTCAIATDRVQLSVKAFFLHWSCPSS